MRADGLGRIAEAIRGCAGGRAAIFMHEDADGDAVGSAMALSLALRAMGVEPSVMYEGRFPAIFDFMGISPDVTSAGGPARGGPGPCGDADGKPYGLGIALDAGDIPRLSLGSEFGKCRVTANIDHHRTNAMFADLNHVDPAMCATGAIVL
ncbi:MAG: DHH family phosphoesterase, partial [Oscillospiraceae bacterium]|nr:DHH family phosphoesterase [Oscillospiraceae bacterium]